MDGWFSSDTHNGCCWMQKPIFQSISFMCVMALSKIGQRPHIRLQVKRFTQGVS